MNNRTILGIKRNGDVDSFYPQELRTSKLNAWKGWSCSVGQYNISINELGDMKGGDCGVGGHLGNIYKDFVIPTKWHTCPYNHCSCFFDIGVPKKSQDNTSEYVEFKSKDQELKFQWFLTSKCNYECSYCPSDFHNKLPHKNTFEQANKGLDNLLSKLGGRAFTMSMWGGEPTLFPRYLDLCKKIHKHGSKVITTTNGSRSQKYLASLIHYSSISLSVHEEFYDENRLINNLKSIIFEINSHNLTNWLMVRCMVKPGSLANWRKLIMRLDTEIPDFSKNVKLTLNTLLDPLSDNSDLSDDIFKGYSDTELALLQKYGRLTDV